MNILKRTEGQNLVEFALVLTVLIVILFGVFDLGRVFNAYVVITNAAREGAYYGALHPTLTNEIKLRAIAEAQNSGITISQSDIFITTTGGSIVVTVDHDFSLLSSWLLGVDTLGLRGRAEMAVF